MDEGDRRRIEEISGRAGSTVCQIVVWSRPERALSKPVEDSAVT
jgi:hypothetical protein